MHLYTKHIYLSYRQKMANLDSLRCMHLSLSYIYMRMQGNRLTSHYQSKLVMKKLAKALSMLSKVRHYVKMAELKKIYNAIFESHLSYGCQIWFLSSTQLVRRKLKKVEKKLCELCHLKTSKNHLRLYLKNEKFAKSKTLWKFKIALSATRSSKESYLNPLIIF